MRALGREVAVGEVFTSQRRFADSDIDGFAALSGDQSPLHMDASFAGRQGFAGRVVHGGLLVSQLSELIGMRFPARQGMWHSVALDFVRPVIAGDEVTLEAAIESFSEAARLVELRCSFRRGADTVARGKARVVLFADG